MTDWDQGCIGEVCTDSRKIIVETKLGTQDVAQTKVGNIIKCLKDNGYGELPEELGQEALDNYFDMRQGKAESTQDYIFREEVLTVALHKDTAIDLHEKIRGYWLMRTSNLTEREISGIKIIIQGQTELAQVKRAINQTIVVKKGEEVRDDLREAGDGPRDRPGGYAEAPNFHLDGNSDDDQADTISESESNCSEQWYELDGQEQEALISLRDARKKLPHATKSGRFYPKGGGRAMSTGKSIDELKKVTSCNRCGAIGHWEEDCSQPARSRKKGSSSAKGKGKSRRFRREKSDGKGAWRSIELPDCGGLQRWFEKSNVTHEGSSWIRGSGLWCCQESLWSETCCSDGTDMCTRR